MRIEDLKVGDRVLRDLTSGNRAAPFDPGWVVTGIGPIRVEVTKGEARAFVSPSNLLPEKKR